MRVVVVGSRRPGPQARRFAGADYVASVDPVGDDADYESCTMYRSIATTRSSHASRTSLSSISFAIASTTSKHVLIEKPLWTPRDEDISELERAARSRGVVVYTAYNHRFEPHFVRMRDLIVVRRAWHDL